MKGHINQIDDVDHRYILFWLNDELYGTPLLSAREVVGSQPIKSIPNTSPHFMGVMNIRGEVIGLLNLKKRFSLPDTFEGEPVLIVFETEAGTVAAPVDKLDSVVNIGPEDISFNPAVQTTVPMEFLIGIGKITDQLVTLLDLKRVLEKDDIVDLRRSQQHFRSKGA